MLGVGPPFVAKSGTKTRVGKEGRGNQPLRNNGGEIASFLVKRFKLSHPSA